MALGLNVSANALTGRPMFLHLATRQLLEWCFKKVIRYLYWQCTHSWKTGCMRDLNQITKTMYNSKYSWWLSQKQTCVFCKAFKKWYQTFQSQLNLDAKNVKNKKKTTCKPFQVLLQCTTLSLLWIKNRKVLLVIVNWFCSFFSALLNITFVSTWIFALLSKNNPTNAFTASGEDKVNTCASTIIRDADELS